MRSGLIALAILVPILLFGGFWGVFLVGLVAVAIGVREFVGFALPRRPAGTTAIALAASWLLMSGVALGRFHLLAGALAGVVMLTTLWTMFTARETTGLADRGARLLLAVCYAGGLVGFLPLLRSMDGGLGWMWLALGLGWCGDIGGYFAGRAFGQHKLSPMISPKKTWEGFLGGVLLAVLWATLFKLVFFPSMRTIDCLLLGILGVVGGVVGDLVESVFKRSYQVKDSGRFLPGHGGLLDRIDSVLFAIPVTYLYVAIVVSTAS